MRKLLERLFPPPSLSRLEQLSGFHRRRLVKRIDETRELAELLQTRAPELLRSHPWILLWLEDNDSFLVELAQILGEAPLDGGAAHRSGIRVRPWPVPLISPNATSPDSNSQCKGQS